jgi:hypothetical protein
VLRFDPSAETGSFAFNPLEEIRLGTPHEVGDVQNLVTILVDPEGKGLIDHWAKTSHAFLTGAILHVLSRARATGGVARCPRSRWRCPIRHGRSMPSIARCSITNGPAGTRIRTLRRPPAT